MLVKFIKPFTTLDKEWALLLNLQEDQTYFIDNVIKITDQIIYYNLFPSNNINKELHSQLKSLFFTKNCFLFL